MDSLHRNTFRVLSPEHAVPSLDELEHRFISFWVRMKRNLQPGFDKDDLSYRQTKVAKDLAIEAHNKRLRRAGLFSLAKEARPQIVSLAKSGARLGGPASEDDVHQLAATLHAESPWMRDVSTWIMTQMLQHITSGDYGLALPPVILAGPPGVGKSHYARALARLASVPVRMIDIGGGSAGFRISGTEKGWGSAQPGIPVETVLATEVANPIMVVDEIDKAGTTYSTKGTSSSITTSMLQLLEHGTAKHFECAFHRLPFDLSRVVWIMTANEIERVPAPLRDRSRVFILPKLMAEDAIAHFDRLTDGHDDQVFADQCHRFIANMCAQPSGISLRQIQQLAGAVRAPMQRILH